MQSELSCAYACSSGMLMTAACPSATSNDSDQPVKVLVTVPEQGLSPVILRLGSIGDCECSASPFGKSVTQKSVPTVL